MIGSFSWMPQCALKTRPRPSLRRRQRGPLIVALVSVLVGCHGLLDVSNPTLIQDKDIANASGADARRLSVVWRFGANFGLAVGDVALFTDERVFDWKVLTIVSASQYLDQRQSEAYEATFLSGRDPHLGPLDEVVTRAAVAIPAVRSYSPDSVRGDFLAELFAFRGYAMLQMAEDLCPGFPINDIRDNLPVYSQPYTTDSAIAYAVTQLDSALANGRDSVQILDLARVAKGRALLDLGQYDAAAAVVAAVSTDFMYLTNPDYGNQLFPNGLGTWGSSGYAVGDDEGGTGLPFVSAHDPRVPTVFKQVRFHDPTDSLYEEQKYTSTRAPIVVASGIEARLIEAEAALHSGDPSWLSTLNALRATVGLGDLVDPGDASARVDLLYRERAFWLYLTGRRLGDLRRLMRNYGRTAESVFPTGAYPLGGVYGTATAIPFVEANEGQFNPNITVGCSIR